MATKSAFGSYTSEDAVRRGLSYLNRHLPDWREYVDVEKLYSDLHLLKGGASILEQLGSVLGQKGVLPSGNLYRWCVEHGFGTWASDPASYCKEVKFCWLAAARRERWDLSKIDDGDVVHFVEGPTTQPRDSRHYTITVSSINAILQGATVVPVEDGYQVQFSHETVFRYDEWKTGHHRCVWLLQDGTIIGHGYEDLEKPFGMLFVFETPQGRQMTREHHWRTWLNAFFPAYEGKF